MLKRTPKIVEKWFHKVYCGDLYIGIARFHETTKQLRLIGYEMGEGRNTIIGFNGTKTSTRELLSYQTIFDKSDPRFCDSFEEAHDNLAAAVGRRVEIAKRNFEKEIALQELFASVVYLKQ